MGILSFFHSNSGVIETTKLIEEYSNLFINDEIVDVGFKIDHDTYIFTNKRLIIEEHRKKEDKTIEYYFIPYSKIESISIEASKEFDSKASLKIYLVGNEYPKVNKEFNDSVDVYEVQKILSSYMIN
ncbi:PH domain-containing protein [Marivirga arenosa]|uniref:PH domain-containing protein n=1 Tax=Marivirga arenosa TaxID=3059076 RepID=A0AA49GG94_9BACT|nr:PH domain-containing protein [Marivirga sp. BKB1-2]WKK80128.2 PH domain-containing protein [Marivirga sp. BKB1-2]